MFLLTLDSGIYEKKNNEENNLILNEGNLIVNENATIKTELNTSEILVKNDGILELNGTIETLRTIALENNSVANIKGNIRKTVATLVNTQIPREKPHTWAAAREQPRDSPVIER